MKFATITLGLTASLFLSAAALAQTANPAEPASQSAEQNQKMSQQYDGLVAANPGFRTNRMHKECDPIEAADLKQQCMASFGNAAGSMGKMNAPPSTPKR